MTPADLVHRFYAEIWNRQSEEAAREVLAEDFRFRGSLGPERQGVDGFLEYVHSVHAAIADYVCIIDDLIEGPGRAAARMRFRGIHQAEFFGVAATGKQIEWAGAAFFTMEGARIEALWVLGDVDSVRRQLGVVAEARFD
ncbi:MAG: ester cyclase [Pseudomonadota bacterium]